MLMSDFNDDDNNAQTHPWFNLLEHLIRWIIVVQLAGRLEILASLLPVAQQPVGLPSPLVSLGRVGVQLNALVAVPDGCVGLL